MLKRISQNYRHMLVADAKGNGKAITGEPVQLAPSCGKLHKTKEESCDCRRSFVGLISRQKVYRVHHNPHSMDKRVMIRLLVAALISEGYDFSLRELVEMANDELESIYSLGNRHAYGYIYVRSGHNLTAVEELPNEGAPPIKKSGSKAEFYKMMEPLRIEREAPVVRDPPDRYFVEERAANWPVWNEFANQEAGRIYRDPNFGVDVRINYGNSGQYFEYVGGNDVEAGVERNDAQAAPQPEQPMDQEERGMGQGAEPGEGEEERDAN